MIKVVFLLFLIGHVLADFYLQTSKLALEKDLLFTKLLKHCLIYMLTMIVIIIPVISIELLLWTVIICLVHFVVDLIKFLLKKKFSFSFKLDTSVFFIDQLVHILTIVFAVAAIFYLSVPFDYLGWIGKVIEQSQIDPINILSWVLIILIIIKPISIIIRKVLFHYRPTNNDEADGYPNAGALIGILERSIILLLLSVGQYSAIGFVLTAKSIARYNKMADDPKFSEYYLLGTLLSSLLVIVIYLIIF
ncbi:MAG TPA: DUF3307 domain-containing protein [Bacilli bacterium]|nr:DUF3307 domain-containing protein [Bacilli bacterium]